jgi:hypothetical protein
VFALAACWHAWDDYEVLPTSDGDDDDDGSTGSVCTRLCSAYRYCIGPFDDCEQDCEPQVVNCSTVELDKLSSCIDGLEACPHPGQADTIWTVCLIDIDCYESP